MSVNEQENDNDFDDVEDYTNQYRDDPAAEGSDYPNAEENMAPAGVGSVDDGAMEKSPNYRRGVIMGFLHKNKWYLAGFSVFFFALLGILAATTGKGKSGSSADNNSLDSGVAPIVFEASAVNKEVLSTLQTTIENTYERHGLNKDDLATEGSAQRKALVWMAMDKNVNKMEHTEALNRYFLAVFFYSTNMIPSVHTPDPPAWKVADNWMSNAHSCDWMGIECNEQKEIIAIRLPSNNLTGWIPVDISIIGNRVEELDLTDNLIHMRELDFDAFLSLKNLKRLLMNDNFLYNEDGLPTQFGALKNLEEMRLSYNLFEGKLSNKNSVLKNMTKMAHLEIESNYLSGSLPDDIMTMDQLTYLYMRRNKLSSNLDIFKKGNFANMFAIWLDDNHFTGTIPSEIGLMSGLASLSIAKMSLTGSIPEELGNLKELRRLWLFNNELTGSIPESLNNLENLEVLQLHNNSLVGDMPEGVCSSVQKSDYEYKALTSDCLKEVKCASSCCTQCY